MRDLSEIKFRIWDVLDKDWVEVGSGTLPQIALVFGKGGADFNTPMIAQQWTGLYDKKNTSVFEGDVIKIRFDNGETISWKKYLVLWDALRVQFGLTETQLVTDSLPFDYDECEVVGSILENTDLIPYS